MRKLYCFLIAILSFLPGVAQEVTWSVDFNSVFDNREGKDNYSPDQTIAFTRLAPEVGLSVLGGEHRIAGGLSWNQPIGNKWKDYKLCPTVYYTYKKSSLRISAGMFPRTQLVEKLPTFLYSDSMAYQEPNIRGVLIQNVRPRGYAEMFIDWRSLQTETQREAFNANFNGMWNPKGVLLLGANAQYSHLAKQKDAGDSQSVNDDLMLHPFVGVDLSKRTFLDSLVVKTGAVVAFERDRADNEWQTRAGALVNVLAEWKWLGIEESLFVGKGLMPLYPRYHQLLNMGDPYYLADTYSRTDINFYIFRNQFVNFETSLVFHLTKDVTAFWQQLKLRVYIDSDQWSKRKEKFNQTEYLRNNY